MRRAIGVWLIALVLTPASLAAGGEDRAVSARYEGRLVRLRRPALGSELLYSAEGELQQGVAAGWENASHMWVRSVRISEDDIGIIGDRVFLIFDPQRKRFRDYFELYEEPALRAALFPADNRGKGHKAVLDQRRVRIRVSRTGLDPDSVLGNILAPGDELGPDAATRALGFADAVEPARLAGKVVTAPEPIDTPDPQYDAIARLARLSGTVRLDLVLDTEGQVRSIAVSRPLGMGLDEQAVDTVRRWRFYPATRQGHPVPVRIAVEVSFKIGFE